MLYVAFLNNFIFRVFQEEHEYNVRVFARNEIGASEPLQTEEPVKIIRPDGKFKPLSVMRMSDPHWKRISV